MEKTFSLRKEKAAKKKVRHVVYAEGEAASTTPLEITNALPFPLACPNYSGLESLKGKKRGVMKIINRLDCLLAGPAGEYSAARQKDYCSVG